MNQAIISKDRAESYSGGEMSEQRIVEELQALVLVRLAQREAERRWYWVLAAVLAVIGCALIFSK